MLTFGVEFEFVVAALNPASTYESRDPRFSEFFPREGGSSPRQPQRGEYPTLTEPEKPGGHERWLTIARHIRSTLTRYKYPTSILCLPCSPQEYQGWDLRRDESIKPPRVDRPVPDPYTWYPVELVSPILDFTPQNLTAVERLCNVLTSTYKININNSCGLHVHIGNGTKGLDLGHCKKLMSILYTFEPQLNTLHEPERVGSFWCQSLRNLMPVVDQNTGKKLSPLEVVTLIMEAKSVDKIASQILDNYHHEAAYSMKGIVDFERGNVRQKKPTIEFRQHQGTLDGLEVRNWITVVAGIARYAKDVYLSQLYDLICKISPKSRFTVTDLLKEIGLHDSATYYQDRLYFVPEERQSPLPELSFAQPQTYSYSGMDAFPRKSHATSPGDSSQDPEHAATFKRILSVANETEEQKRARLEDMMEICDPKQPVSPLKGTQDYDLMKTNTQGRPRGNHSGEDQQASSSSGTRNTEDGRIREEWSHIIQRAQETKHLQNLHDLQQSLYTPSSTSLVVVKKTSGPPVQSWGHLYDYSETPGPLQRPQGHVGPDASFREGILGGIPEPFVVGGWVRLKELERMRDEQEVIHALEDEIQTLQALEAEDSQSDMPGMDEIF